MYQTDSNPRISGNTAFAQIALQDPMTIGSGISCADSEPLESSNSAASRSCRGEDLPRRSKGSRPRLGAGCSILLSLLARHSRYDRESQYRDYFN